MKMHHSVILVVIIVAAIMKIFYRACDVDISPSDVRPSVTLVDCECDQIGWIVRK